MQGRVYGGNNRKGRTWSRPSVKQGSCLYENAGPDLSRGLSLFVERVLGIS